MPASTGTEQTRHSSTDRREAWTTDELAGDPHANREKADKVRSMFAAIARSYELNNTLHSFGRDAAWRRRAVRLAEVRESDAVLDVACGTGDLTRAFAKRGPHRVVGLDFTQEMLDIAESKRRDASAGEAERTEYIRGDAMDIPFPDATFDVVSIAFGLRNVVEPARALGEFRRVLRPGGRLVVLEFSTPRIPVLGLLSRLYTDSIMPWTATLIARDRSGAYRYLPRSVSTFMDRGAVVAAMERAGFGDVSRHPMTAGICVCYRGVIRA